MRFLSEHLFLYTSYCVLDFRQRNMKAQGLVGQSGGFCDEPKAEQFRSGARLHRRLLEHAEVNRLSILHSQGHKRPKWFTFARTQRFQQRINIVRR